MSAASPALTAAWPMRTRTPAGYWQSRKPRTRRQKTAARHNAEREARQRVEDARIPKDRRTSLANLCLQRRWLPNLLLR
jgi:hypothetical protein